MIPRRGSEACPYAPPPAAATNPLPISMPLTLNELEQGIHHWRNSTSWPQDFHNEFYRNRADIHPNGLFTREWWDRFVPVLSRWRALRPQSRASITARATPRFNILTQAWQTAVVPVMESDIATIDWSRISPFPDAVAPIKNTLSPVFTSKFCHFLAPHIFPVIDNHAMGRPFKSYEHYYLSAQSEWRSTATTVRNTLARRLTKAIGDPIASYPMKCKIIELCLIGRHRPA
jgi:hypothetical protein